MIFLLPKVLIAGPSEVSRYRTAKVVEEAFPNVEILFAETFGDAVEELILSPEIGWIFTQWDLARFSAADLVSFIEPFRLKCFVTDCTEKEYKFYFDKECQAEHLKNGFTSFDLREKLSIQKVQEYEA